MKRFTQMVRRVPKAAAVTIAAFLATVTLVYAGMVQATDSTTGASQWLITGATSGPSSYYIPDAVYKTLTQQVGTVFGSGTVFLAPNDAHTWQLAQASIRYASATSAASTVQVEVAGAGVAMGSGTNQLTPAMALNSTVNTTINGTLIATPTTLVPGGAVNVIPTGSVAGMTGFVLETMFKRTS